MNVIRFINGLGHDQILNLNQVTSIEKPSSPTGLVLHFGKEHMQITLKAREVRDELFEKIYEEMIK